MVRKGPLSRRSAVSKVGSHPPLGPFQHRSLAGASENGVNRPALGD
jgi:hypothetical protein